MPSNLDTLQQLKITLARWKAPSAWDVVQQDEPLDKPKGEWVPTTACNVNTTQAIAIAAGIALSTEGTGSGQQGLYPETAYGQGNLLPRGGILPEGRLPYPRNRKEQRTYDSLAHRLPELIRRAEKVLGPRANARLASAWNDEFWRMMTRDHVADERRNKSGR